jgi:hypothetical protein
MHRRDFLEAAIALAAAPAGRGAEKFDLAAIERPRVLKAASTISSPKPTIGGPIHRTPAAPTSSATA